MRNILHVASTEGANSHKRSGHHHCMFFKAVWRAAIAIVRGRTEGANA